jgi:malate permease and related proteins
MQQSIAIINRVLPILLLLFVGYWLRRRSLIGEKTIADLRWLVVNLALPAVLFVSFLNIEMKSEYLWIFVLVFGLCVLLYLAGAAIRARFTVPTEYFPFLATGFEYGMLGISLFGAAYGLNRIGYIAVVDLGHEIFIWFVLLPMLLIKRDGAQNLNQVAKAFLTSPVVIAILAGIVLNILGLSAVLPELPLLGGMIRTFDFLGNLTVPLILLIIGYGISFEARALKRVLGLILLRLGILVPLVLLLNIYLIRGTLKLEPIFEAALFSLFVLPPPFIIPLYLRPGLGDDERAYINTALTVYTLISIFLFILYFVAHPLP